MEEQLRKLGVRLGAGWDEINSSYRAMIRKYHPDLYGKDPELRRIAERITKELNLAMEKLRESNYAPIDYKLLDRPETAAKRHETFSGWESHIAKLKEEQARETKSFAQALRESIAVSTETIISSSQKLFAEYFLDRNEGRSVATKGNLKDE